MDKCTYENLQILQMYAANVHPYKNHLLEVFEKDWTSSNN